MTDRPIYEFEGVRVDVGRMAAVRGNTAIPLESKAFDVLVFLIERRDRLVAPDNDRIVVAGRRDGVWNLYTVSRTTRATSMLTAFTSGSGYVRYPTWSPQGTRIVFERAMETASVRTMTLPSGQ